MTTEFETPIYSVYIITEKNKYNVTAALTSLDFGDQEKQIAASASLSLADVDVDGSKKLSDLITLRDRVIIVANDGNKKDNVFRGYVWDMSPKEALDEVALALKCYDSLIYWQESEDSIFFSSGQSTSSIMNKLSKKWGIGLAYNYEVIAHGKLVLRGAIADFVSADVLDSVQNKCGKKYAILGLTDRDGVNIRTAGDNKTIYKLKKGKNIIEIRGNCTLNGVTTQVVIVGKADDDDKAPVEATVKGDTKKYGTLQKIITRSEDTSLEDAKKEAKGILAEKGKPQWEYDISAVDIPWIRKGDKVEIEAKPLKGTYLVKSISHEASNRSSKMTLTVVKFTK